MLQSSSAFHQTWAQVSISNSSRLPSSLILIFYFYFFFLYLPRLHFLISLTICVHSFYFFFSFFSSRQSPNNEPPHYTLKYVGRLQCFPILAFVLSKIVSLFYCLLLCLFVVFSRYDLTRHLTSYSLRDLNLNNPFLSLLSFLLTDIPTRDALAVHIDHTY